MKSPPTQDERRRQALIRQQLFGSAPLYLGRYVIERRLGAGAMGAVYLCRDEQLSRMVAIKILHRAATDEARSRVYQEARGLAQVSHPNVVTVHEVVEAKGEVLLVMAYVPGPTLAEWALKQTPQHILKVCIDAGRGLAAVHDVGLIHRDFKPTNVLVGEDGWVRVADFGLVGRSQQRTTALPAPNNSRLTRTGVVLGTPAYMAPEQRLTGTTNIKTDQFAYAKTVCELLQGTRPTESEIALPSLPKVQQILNRGMAADPAARWPSMTALLEALEKVNAPTSQRRRVVGVGILFALFTAGALFVSSKAPLLTEPHLPLAASLLERNPSEAAQVLLTLPDEGPHWQELADQVLGNHLTEHILPLSNHSRFAWGHDFLLTGDREGNRRRIDQSGIRPLANGPLMLGGYFQQKYDTMSHHELANRQKMAQIREGKGIKHRCLWYGSEGTTLLGTEGLFRQEAGKVHQLAPSPPFGNQHCFVTESGLVVALGNEGQVQAYQGESWQVLPILGSKRITGGRHHIALATDQGALWLIDEKSHRKIGQFPKIRKLVFSPQDEYLAVMTLGKVEVVFLNEERAHLTFLGDWVSSNFAFDLTAHHLALGSYEGDIAVIALASKSTRWLRGHTLAITDLQFSPDGRLASLSQDHTLRIWGQLGGGEILGQQGGFIWHGTLDSKGRHLATTHSNGVVGLWDLTSQGHHQTIGGMHDTPLFMAEFNSPGDKLAVGAHGETAWLHTLNEAKPPPLPLEGHETWAYFLSFSPDGQSVYSGSKGGIIRRFSANKPSSGQVLGQHKDPYDRRVNALCVRDDWVYSASGNGEILAWPTTGAGPSILLWKGHERGNLHCPPGGPLLAWATGSHGVGLIDGTKLISTLEIEHPYAAVVHRGEGSKSLVAVASYNKEVHLFEGDVPIAQVVGLSGVVEFMAFDNAGERLAIALPDGSIQVMQARDGHPIMTLQAHDGPVRFVGFAESGDLLSAGHEGIVRRWSIEKASRRDRLKRTHCLSSGRRQQLYKESKERADAAAALCEEGHVGIFE